VSGVSATVAYPGTKLSIPPPLLTSRVTNQTGVAGLFQTGDNDVVVPGDGRNDRLSVGLVAIPGPIPPGPLARVVFDCDGDSPPTLGEFTCTPDVSSALGLGVPATCQLSLSTSN
jgi:hypothetical protein